MMRVKAPALPRYISIFKRRRASFGHPPQHGEAAQMRAQQHAAPAGCRHGGHVLQPGDVEPVDAGRRRQQQHAVEDRSGKDMDVAKHVARRRPAAERQAEIFARRGTLRPAERTKNHAEMPGNTTPAANQRMWRMSHNISRTSHGRRPAPDHETTRSSRRPRDDRSARVGRRHDRRRRYARPSWPCWTPRRSRRRARSR